ncbi:MAG: hypothetical protein JWP19_2238 [Rhodoglobus sp.]|nr:hypothetical protein [Rhodoglobus sp.]
MDSIDTTGQLVAIRSFAVGLSQAVHDAKHESQGHQVVHLWDTDSLYLPVRGIMALDGQEGSDENQLVQSLFSSNFLGPVRLLAPHRAELIAQIASWQSERISKRQLQTVRDQLLNSKEMAQVERFSAKLDALEEHSDDGDVGVDQVVAELRRLDYAAFVYVEALSGSWQSRITRLTRDLQLLNLAPAGESMRILQETAEYRLVHEGLSRLRRKEHSFSTAVDAAAIASLIRMNERANGRAGREFPRFFTSSTALRTLFATNPVLQERLSFHSDRAGRQAWHSTVWRERAYYFIRATFPSLRMRASRAPREGDRGLDSLEELADDFRFATEASDDNLSLQLLLKKEIELGDEQPTTLFGLIEDLQHSRMSRIWISNHWSDVSNDLAGSLTRLRRLETTALQAATKHEDLLDVGIRRGLDEFRMVTELFDEVEKALQPIVRVKGRAISLKNDLGSSRLGVEYGDEDPLDSIRIVLDPSGAASIDHAQLFTIFDPTDLARTPAASLRACTLLLSVENYDACRKLLDHLRHQNQSVQHRLLGRIARVGSREGMSENQLDLFVRQVQADWEHLSVGDRPSLTLGYAYAVFLAWERSAQGGAWSSVASDSGGWIAWIVRVLQSSVPLMSALGQLHANNLIVYASALTSVAVDGGETLLRNLEKIAVQRDDFHLLDTVGYALLRRLELERNRLSLREFEALADRAIQYIERAQELFPADLDIEQHLGFARDLRRQSPGR